MDQTQTTRYVSGFEPLLYVLAFTLKDFHYVHTGPSTKGSLLRNYSSTREYTTPLSTQSPLHKREHKAKKKIHLVITKITNISW